MAPATAVHLNSTGDATPVALFAGETSVVGVLLHGAPLQDGLSSRAFVPMRDLLTDLPPPFIWHGAQRARWHASDDRPGRYVPCNDGASADKRALAYFDVRQDGRTRANGGQGAQGWASLFIGGT